jgi:hypothetical protein
MLTGLFIIIFLGLSTKAIQCTVVNQNKIGQSVTLDSFTIQRFV